MNTEQAQEPEMRDDANAEDGNGRIEESGKVDRIRNILFGPQVQDYEGRFQCLDERLAKEAAEARADVQKRLEALEHFLKGELESLSNRLNAEQSERGLAIEKLGRDLGQTAKALELKIKNLDEDLAFAIHELFQQLLEQSEDLSVEIKDRHE